MIYPTETIFDWFRFDECLFDGKEASPIKTPSKMMRQRIGAANRYPRVIP